MRRRKCEKTNIKSTDAALLIEKIPINKGQNCFVVNKS